MKIAYLDCFSGVAGDMFAGALLDAGGSFDHLEREIAKLGLEGLELRAEKCVRRGVTGTNFTVGVAHDHHHRSLSTIERIIGESGLSAAVKQRSIQVFRRLGEAEAAVHGVDIEKVHFHEVGALDAIVDIVGAAVLLDELGIEKIFCSPVNLGSGTVKAAHGVMPVPAPATAALVKGLPTYSDGPAMELTTPTGAALISTLTESFGPMPAMAIASIGYGAGDNDFRERANMLRVMIGEASAAPEATEVWVLEANIDDMSPQAAGYVRELLLEEGALDVTLAPVFMKKDRPGYTIEVLAEPKDRERMSGILFAETTTLGLRMFPAQRRVLERDWKTVVTPYGEVRVKVARSGGARTFSPEYEDCRRLAREKKAPFRDVWQQANFAYLKEEESER